MKKTFLTAVTILGTAFGAAAQDNNAAHDYNLFDIGYERTFYKSSYGDVLDDANGLYINLNVAPADPFFIHGDYHYAKPDIIGDDGDVSSHDLKIGGGVQVPMGAASFFTHLGGRYNKLNPSGARESIDNWGFYVQPGLRLGFGSSAEIYGSLIYTTTDALGLGAEVGTAFFITDNVAINLIGRFEDPFNTFGVGVRFAW